MARRGIFNSIKEQDAPRPERDVSASYPIRGATRNMLASINELAEKAIRADQVLEGEAVVELDPASVDASFVADRMEDDSAFADLVEAMRSRGQDTPILVRPHPSQPGRFQTVFGHRRLRAARELGRKVKAVVRSISDADHVVAQGQENAARENLSFIERALFAQRLSDRGYDRATIQAALAIDAPMLTRMLSVSGRVPEPIALAIGPAKSIGRDRWIEFAQFVEHPDARRAASNEVEVEGFSLQSSEERFERILATVKAVGRAGKAASKKPATSRWQTADKLVAAELIDSGRSVSLAFKSKAGAGFGRFVAANLDRLYEDYKRNVDERKG